MAKRRLIERPVVLDFFAGCGGLSLGLEDAGFFPLFVNELNSDALATYLLNRQQLNPRLGKFSVRDVKSLVGAEGKLLSELIDGIYHEYGISAKDGQIDLVVGGPPCQGFSGIGHRRSYSVDKKQLPSNHLYEDYAYVISQIRPRIFLFENVKGLLSSRWTAAGSKGEVWADVLAAFRSIPGYSVAWGLVHAKTYGVPQNRPRVLLVGIREDVAVVEGDDALSAGVLPSSEHLRAPDLLDLLGDLVDGAFVNGGSTVHYPSDATSAVQESLRYDPSTGAVAKLGDPLHEQDYSRHSPRVVDKFMRMHADGGKIPDEYRTKKFAQRVLPERWGPAGPTITATSLPDDYVHFSQPRTLTVREWARLQCFPDWYKFAGPRTTGGLRRAGNPQRGIFDRELPKYTQIGNAVPVWLARALGEHFLRLLAQ